MNPKLVGLFFDHGITLMMGIAVIFFRDRLTQNIPDDHARLKRQRLFTVLGSILIICGGLLIIHGYLRLQ